MRQNNRGFSLVELIVVIAIMAVLTGMVTVGVGILSGKAAKEARDKLLSSLESVRVQTMGKDAITAKLSYDGTKGQYILTYTYEKTTSSGSGSVTETVTETKTIGNSKCTIYYADNTFTGTVSTAADCASASGVYALSEGTPITFSFDRSSGALKPYRSEGADYYITHIYVVQGTHDPYGIRLYPETGKMMEE